MNILCTVCARGGSKGVPGKNIKLLNGKPLIAYTIEVAQKWGKADKIIVSTDSEKIADIAKNYDVEVPFLRPVELAGDSSGKIGAIKHAITFLEGKGEYYDIIVDLDVTAPLRTIDDLDNALKLFLDNDVNNVYSVCEARRNPYFNMVELSENGRVKLCKNIDKTILSRQTAPKIYDMNASIYVYKRDFIMNTDICHSDNTIAYVMPPERSIDIDNQLDFEFIEFLLEKGVVKID
jgi:CMP-N,N'-diacetyllegionaminic acid synthase